MNAQLRAYETNTLPLKGIYLFLLFVHSNNLLIILNVSLSKSGLDIIVITIGCIWELRASLPGFDTSSKLNQDFVKNIKKTL
jgi:hypothetical protein